VELPIVLVACLGAIGNGFALPTLEEPPVGARVFAALFSFKKELDE